MTGWIGPTIAAGSQLLGSSGLFGNKGPGAREQINNAAKSSQLSADSGARGHIAGVMKAAKNWGIHPLVALNGGGGGHSSSMPIEYNQPNNNTGDAIAAGGTAIARAVEAYQTQQQRLQNDLLRAQVDGQEISNAKNASDLAIKTQGATAGSVNMLPSEALSPSPDSEGLEAAHDPLYKRFKISDKFHLYGLSKNASEAFEGYGHAGGTVAGALALLGSSGLYARDIRSWAKKRSDKMKKKFYQERR